MSEAGDGITSVQPLPAPRKGQTLLAWLVIVAAIGIIFWFREEHPVEYAPGMAERATYLAMQMQARYLVGAVELIRNEQRWFQDVTAIYTRVYAQAEALNTGPVGQRMRFLTLAGELKGPEEALKQLHLLQDKLKGEGLEPSPAESNLFQTLERLYDDYAHERLDAPSVSPRERLELQDQLGWFGELALAPANGPDTALRYAVVQAAGRTFSVMLGTIFVLGFIGLAGLVGLIILLVKLFSGRIAHGIQGGTGHGGVYAETFALWLLLFFGISFAAGRWLPHTGPFLLASGLLLSLLALVWPMARGIPWQQVREEVGLYGGRRSLIEPLIGIVNYALTLPFLALGVVIMLRLLFGQRLFTGGAGTGDDFSPNNLPSHPIVPYLVSSDWWGRLQVLILASVIAPVVEETMFRGVLYRHLRDLSSRWAYPLSVGLGMVVASFIFAVIHPQGLIAVPALMGIAFGLTLVREWRGSLVPGMVTHGINNAVVLCFTITALSG
jgi:membrane protease YdiL (CAAX protease family)